MRLWTVSIQRRTWRKFLKQHQAASHSTAQQSPAAFKCSPARVPAKVCHARTYRSFSTSLRETSPRLRRLPLALLPWRVGRSAPAAARGPRRGCRRATADTKRAVPDRQSGAELLSAYEFGALDIGHLGAAVNPYANHRGIRRPRWDRTIRVSERWSPSHSPHAQGTTVAHRRQLSLALSSAVPTSLMGAPLRK